MLVLITQSTCDLDLLFSVRNMCLKTEKKFCCVVLIFLLSGTWVKESHCGFLSCSPSQPKQTICLMVTLTSSMLCVGHLVCGDSWSAESGHISDDACVGILVSACFLCVTLRDQRSSFGSQRAMLVHSQQEGGHCPYAVFTHTFMLIHTLTLTSVSVSCGSLHMSSCLV